MTPDNWLAMLWMQIRLGWLKRRNVRWAWDRAVNACGGEALAAFKHIYPQSWKAAMRGAIARGACGDFDWLGAEFRRVFSARLAEHSPPRAQLRRAAR